MRLRYSSYVKYDFADIAEYIARDSPAQAARMVRLLRQRIKELASDPRLYRLRPEIRNEARLLPVGSYVVLYRVVENAVRIERVVHGARDLPHLPVEDI